MKNTVPSPLPLFNWLKGRATGVLLHPTSLPGGQGIGTIGGAAHRFLDFLQAAGIRYWQICPLGPTGYGDSPYQCYSAFAGNPYLIDLHGLEARGWVDAATIARIGAGPAGAVDFGALYTLKMPALRRAYDLFLKAGEPALGPEGFAAFKARNAAWLESYAWFRTIKEAQNHKAWWDWPAALRGGKTPTGRLREQLRPEAEAHQFYQYVFFTQWAALRAQAARRGVEIIGDIPIFVGADSADVWAHPELFELGGDGRPVASAGVPPDYFSADGQLWGNPLYRWDAHAADGYQWWRDRMQATFEVCDVVRIDHFRGFDEFWRVPLPAANARTGEWRRGPGLDLFRALKAAFPTARIIAEDLGTLTPTVVQLLADTGLPGMAVLQFAFGGDAANAYLPHNLVPNGVVYPGTHDNDTTIGWYASAGEKARDHARRYLRISGAEIGWDLIRASYGAVSRLAVLPMQDVLTLGPEARFNTPGLPVGNWGWRMGEAQLDRVIGDGTAAYLRDLGVLTGRTAG